MQEVDAVLLGRDRVLGASCTIVRSSTCSSTPPGARLSSLTFPTTCSEDSCVSPLGLRPHLLGDL